ncbi:MAG: hypothetical protein RLZZ543_1075 [Bacteroidota bacterium]|jgi:hypothetical protein
MKKSLLIIAGIVAFLTSTVSAQFQYKHAEAFEKGITLIDVQTSLGMYRDKNFVTQRPPVFIGVDYGISNDFSGGVFGGWNQRTYKDAFYPAYDVNYFYYGGRLSLHMTEFLRNKTPLKFNPHKVDIYGTVWAGRQVSRQTTFVGTGFLDSGTTTIVGAYLGAKVYTNYPIGFLVEAGMGPYGLLNIGVCGKF